jgi:TolB-like protein/lipoprotein NlpI
LAEASHAVFLSYASQDAGAAQKIAEALRAAGIEVFLDQSELRGGDAWDQKIRHEIHDCVLFIPIISQHSQERLEGYFRHEWNLAIERTHHMAQQKAFLVPVVVDGTGDREAFVPDAFRAVQWTRLPAGETSHEFVTRIKKLLSGESGPVPTMGSRAAAVSSRRSSPFKLAVLAVALAAVGAYLFIETPWTAKFAPPAHSVAVLPFVNMSGDKEQEYFSDGLTEELLNSLAKINELQVAARTSAFSFKGTNTDIGTIARKLNVASVLEGSVRRSGNTVRITTQLINAVTGFHQWSETYDRDLGDMLKLETEVAGSVASALKVTLLGDEAARIELGGTRNPAAFDAYLKGLKAYSSAHGASDYQSAIAAYTEAIRLDPNYALAFAYRSGASVYRAELATGPARREILDRAQADAREAIRLAPELAEAHLALAGYFVVASGDFTLASEEYERAMALAPGNALVLGEGGRLAVFMGQFDAGLAAARRAVALDPLNMRSRSQLGQALYWARQYQEAVTVNGQLISLDPEYTSAHAYRGLSYYGLGDLQDARVSCEAKPDSWLSQWCLTVTYNKLGRSADAQAQLKKLQATSGDVRAAYQYATIYAQWGDSAKALGWLDTAMRVHDPGLLQLKIDPLMDPLRKEPRFQAVMRELKFPQ